MFKYMCSIVVLVFVVWCLGTTNDAVVTPKATFCPPEGTLVPDEWISVMFYPPEGVVLPDTLPIATTFRDTDGGIVIPDEWLPSCDEEVMQNSFFGLTRQQFAVCGVTVAVAILVLGWTINALCATAKRMRRWREERAWSRMEESSQDSHDTLSQEEVRRLLGELQRRTSRQ